MKGKCPTCKKGYDIGSIDELPAFPFCSERCRLIDLGRWADGTFVVPGPELPATREGAPGAEDDEDD